MFDIEKALACHWSSVWLQPIDDVAEIESLRFESVIFKSGR
jgi:hypothetical protein